MTSERAYYSLIQFCPDASRLEAANIGVLLYCPGKAFIKAEVSKSNKRVRQFFGDGSFDRAQLNTFKQSFRRRFELERDTFRTTDDVERFIATRANQLRMTPLRPMKSMDPQTDLQSLFVELVGGRILQPRPRLGFPELEIAFHRPELAGKIEFEKEVEIPTLRNIVTVPYAYTNGALNLIRTCGFAGSREDAFKRAEIIALQGHLFRKHSQSKPIKMELVVVSRFAPTLEDVRPQIASLFDDVEVKHFPDSRLDELIAKVQTEAQPLR